jgi:hypothetical protein
MYILANRDIELSCDEAVVRTFGETAKSAYALTLIGLEERKSGFSPLCSNFAKNAIEERIESIMKIKKKTFISVAAAGIVTVAVAGGLLYFSAIPNTVATADFERLSDGKFSVNKNGQTYGSGADCVQPEDYPDLISVTATNGKEGYVYFTDWYEAPPKSPESAAESTREAQRTARGDAVYGILPVYAVDGKTIIGEYEIDFGVSFVGTEKEIEAFLGATAK